MDLALLLDYYNTHNPFCQQLGISVEELRTDYARAVKTVTPEDVNPLKVPHGGLYFTMADTACGFAINTRGYVAVTVNSTFNFLRGAKVGDRLIAEAFERKSGRTICIFDVQIKNQDDDLVGTGTFTFYSTGQKLNFDTP